MNGIIILGALGLRSHTSRRIAALAYAAELRDNVRRSWIGTGTRSRLLEMHAACMAYIAAMPVGI